MKSDLAAFISGLIDNTSRLGRRWEGKRIKSERVLHDSTAALAFADFLEERDIPGHEIIRGFFDPDRERVGDEVRMSGMFVGPANAPKLDGLSYSSGFSKNAKKVSHPLWLHLGLHEDSDANGGYGRDTRFYSPVTLEEASAFADSVESYHGPNSYSDDLRAKIKKVTPKEGAKKLSRLDRLRLRYAAATLTQRERETETEEPTDPRDHLTDALLAAFPDAPIRGTSHGHFKVPIGDNRVLHAHLEKGKAHLGFYSFDPATVRGLGDLETTSQPELQRGTLDFLRGLRSLVRSLKERGIGVSYSSPTDRRRARLYADTLSREGYYPLKVTQKGNYEWEPGEVSDKERRLLIHRAEVLSDPYVEAKKLRRLGPRLALARLNRRRPS